MHVKSLEGRKYWLNALQRPVPSISTHPLHRNVSHVNPSVVMAMLSRSDLESRASKSRERSSNESAQLTLATPPTEAILVKEQYSMRASSQDDMTASSALNDKEMLHRTTEL